MGIHSTADSMGALMKLLVNDSELKNLMSINEIDQQNYSLLASKYFQSAFISSQLVTEPICSLLIRTAPITETNNEFVKYFSVIIEIYVHDSLEYSGIGGFMRRSHLIQDKLIKLLHNKYINDDKYKFVDGNELQSSIADYKRQYIRFVYKAVYA